MNKPITPSYQLRASSNYIKRLREKNRKRFLRWVTLDEFIALKQLYDELKKKRI